jgi:predicted dehydrogenase
MSDSTRAEKVPAGLSMAVVGMGYWGPNLIRNLHELSQVTELWACDLRADRLETITRRFPATRATSRYDQVLEDPSIDAVLLATPISTHHRLATAALHAGKHVFVEKPLAASSEEVRSLIELATRRELVLMPGHTFLYSPPVTMIRNLIESGDLGEIYFVSTSRVNLGLHQPDVSVTWDLGPHDFSILRHWLGANPARVSALARGCIIPGIPDVAFIDLEYDDTSTEPLRVFDSGATLPDPATFGEFTLTYRTGDILSPHVEAAEPIYRELQDFCLSIIDGTVPRSSAQLGLDVVQTIEAVDASLAAGGIPVTVESGSSPPAGNGHPVSPPPLSPSITGASRPSAALPH